MLDLPLDLPEPHGIGVLTPHDFALDRELWRWLPGNAALHTTRLPRDPDPATAIRAATRDVLVPSPGVVICTVPLPDAATHVLAAGAPAAITTPTALAAALALLHTPRLALLTPTPPPLNPPTGFGSAATIAGPSGFGSTAVPGIPPGFGVPAGVVVTDWRGIGLTGQGRRLRYADVLAAATAVDTSGADALYIDGPNVPTYDLIAPLERLLGLPVLTANQVGVWAALRVLGLAAVGPGQRLVDATPPGPVSPGTIAA